MSSGIKQDFNWKIGDQITFVVESGLFEGTFTSEVVGINPRYGIIQIRFPKLDGKLVLIPVGTAVIVKAEPPKNHDEKFMVIDRTGGETRCLVLKKSTGVANRLVNLKQPQDTRVLSVCSGKGGVGKTTFAVNLAFAIAELGERVCILDAALGTGNVDVLLDIAPRYHIGHVLSGKCGFLDIIAEVKPNLHILPGCSGVQPLTELSNYQYNLLADELEQVFPYFDYIIIDTSPGIAAVTTNFISAAKGGFLITTPEPHAITDTYALLKTLVNVEASSLNLNLVVNRVQYREEAENTVGKLRFAAKKFLDFELGYAGFVFEDQRVREANMKQKAVIDYDQSASSILNYREIARYIFSESPQAGDEKTQGGLIARIKNIGRRA
ncbi:MAG: AAA family ATPase [Candidatus Wallacebacter cryptica]